jgi:hypothetical protein
MATERAKRAIERLKKTKPHLFGEHKKPVRQNATGDGVDISDVPDDVIEAIRGLDKKSVELAPNRNLVGMVRAYMELHKCSAPEAYGAIKKNIKPGSFRKATPEPGPTYSGNLDPLDFPKVVKKYQRDYKCTIGEAWRMIEDDHKGLRDEFINLVNK